MCNKPAVGWYKLSNYICRNINTTYIGNKEKGHTITGNNCVGRLVGIGDAVVYYYQP